MTINVALALTDANKFVAEHTYTPSISGCVVVKVRMLETRRSLRVVVLICVKEFSNIMISVPL